MRDVTRWVRGSLASRREAIQRPFPRLPFAEDGILIVDAESGRVLETLPFVAQETESRINGNDVHNIRPLGTPN